MLENNRYSASLARIGLVVFALLLPIHFAFAEVSSSSGQIIRRWVASGSAEIETNVVREETGRNPSLRLCRKADENAPVFLSEPIGLTNGADRWVISGWMRLKNLYFQDPSFHAELSYRWLDKNDVPLTNDKQVAFTTYDIQRQQGLPTQSGTQLSFNWTYIERAVLRPENAEGIQFRFAFLQGDATVWLTDINLRPVENRLSSVDTEKNTVRHSAPELRLRKGVYALTDTTEGNLPLFKPGEPIQMTVYSPTGSWTFVDAWLTDSDGGLLWSARIPWAEGDTATLTVPAKSVTDAEGEALSFHAQLIGETIQTHVAVLGVGVLPLREELSPAMQKKSPFGLVGSPKCIMPRGLAMMHRIGVQWVRYQGVRWRQDDPTIPQEIEKSGMHYALLKLRRNRFLPLVQTFAIRTAPEWALDSAYCHLGEKPHLLDEPFGQWIAHAGTSLPEQTYFKLLNERDRDPDPAYLQQYADLMKNGYQALKAVRPDAVVSVEGGFTVDIVNRLIQLGLYDYADQIDHHMYGTYRRILGLGERLQPMRAAGYRQPVIASEFGVVPGSGNMSVDFREIANGLIRNASCWLAIGGSQFYAFLWGSIGPIIDSTFSNIFFVSEPGSQPNPCLFAYAQLSHLLEGAKPIETPVLDKGLWRTSFLQGEKRIDIVWAEEARSAACWKSEHSVTAIEALGRKTVLQPAASGVVIGVGAAPVIVESNASDTSVAAADPILSAVPPAVVARQTGGKLEPSVAADPADTSETFFPVPPRGWTVRSESTSDCWKVTVPAAIPNGEYTLRWRRQDKTGKDMAFALDRVSLVSDITADIIGIPASGAHQVEIKVENRSTSPWTGHVSAISPPDGRIYPETARWKIAVPPKTTKQWVWNLKQAVPDSLIKDPNFMLRLLSEDGQFLEKVCRTTFRVVPKRPQRIVADGSLDDWIGVEWMDLPSNTFVRLGDRNSAPSDDDDQSARVALVHGNLWLALAVDIQDDFHWNKNSADMIWNGDAIEFALGVRKGGRQEFPDDYYKIAVGLGPNGPVAYGLHVPGGQSWAVGKISQNNMDYFVRRMKNNRTVYEVVLRYGALHMNNRDGISFALAVDEADEQGIREGYLPLFSGVVRPNIEQQGWVTLGK